MCTQRGERERIVWEKISISFNVIVKSKVIFHRYEKGKKRIEKRIVRHYWLTRGSRRNRIFFITKTTRFRAREKEKILEKKMKIIPLLFFPFPFLFLSLFFSFFLSNKQIQSLATRGRHFSNSGGTRNLFIDEILEASVDKRRDSFLLKRNHNGKPRINRVAINKVTTKCKGWPGFRYETGRSITDPLF